MVMYKFRIQIKLTELFDSMVERNSRMDSQKHVQHHVPLFKTLNVSNFAINKIDFYDVKFI